MIGAALQVLSAEEAARVQAVCELVVPGCARTGAEVYVDALLARMDEAGRDATRAAFAALAEAASRGADGLAGQDATPEFALVRGLACEAYYSDFVAPGAPGPGAWSQIGFAPPLATRLAKDWSYLGVRPAGDDGSSQRSVEVAEGRP